MSSSSLPAPRSQLSAPRSSLVLPGDRPAEVVAFETEMVAFFVDAADLLGVPKSVAAIYGVIFASAEPLTFSEIEARVSFSKGSVSQGLRVLREIGAVRVVDAEPLARSNESLDSGNNGGASSSELKARGLQHYEPDMELRKLIQHFLETRLQTQLTAGEGRLERISRQVPADDDQQAGKLRQRIKHLNGWHQKARALMPIARTFLKLTP